jgi:hypothetical protein
MFNYLNSLFFTESDHGTFPIEGTGTEVEKNLKESNDNISSAKLGAPASNLKARDKYLKKQINE